MPDRIAPTNCSRPATDGNVERRRHPPRILVLIPAYNEQAVIGQVVASVRRAMPEATVLVVDDGSADNTAGAAEAAGASVVRHPFNLGIGGAVQTGLKFARQGNYDYAIRLDGDGQHNPADIASLQAILFSKQSDVVVGSRFLRQADCMPIPFMRRLGISVFALLVTILTGRRATDTTSGFSGMNRPAIQTLSAQMPQDYPEVESRVVLHKAGLRTTEIPVQMRPRQAGVSSIDHWRSLYYALKVTIAVLCTALKDVPIISKETRRAHSAGTANHRHHIQRMPADVDHSTHT